MMSDEQRHMLTDDGVQEVLNFISHRPSVVDEVDVVDLLILACMFAHHFGLNPNVGKLTGLSDNGVLEGVPVVEMPDLVEKIRQHLRVELAGRLALSLLGE